MSTSMIKFKCFPIFCYSNGQVQMFSYFFVIRMTKFKCIRKQFKMVSVHFYLKIKGKQLNGLSAIEKGSCPKAAKTLREPCESLHSKKNEALKGLKSCSAREFARK